MKSSFCIKPGYKHRNKPQYFSDKDTKVVWQPEVYELAHSVVKSRKLKYVIDIGCGSGFKLKKFQRISKIIGIDYGANLKLFTKNNPKQRFISYNLENGVPSIEKKILQQAVVICADVIEHIVNPAELLHQLSVLSQDCLYMLISTPDREKYYGVEHKGPPPNPAHVREWSYKEILLLVKEYCFNFPFIFHTISSTQSNDRWTLLILSGTSTRNILKFILWGDIFIFWKPIWFDVKSKFSKVLHSIS